MLGPGQNVPPQAVAGLAHDRVRMRWPHVTSQPLHEVLQSKTVCQAWGK